MPLAEGTAMHLKRWSLPVERSYAAPEGSSRGPRSIRAERRVDLFEDHGRLHVHVDGRKVVHREVDGQLTFGIGKYGCIINADQDLFVGGKKIDDAPSVFPVALHSEAPPPPDDRRLKIAVSPRIVAAVVLALVLLVVRLAGRSSPGAAPEWREVVSTEGGFTANLPAAPAHATETRTRDALTLTMHATSGDLPQRAHFAIVWADLPTDASGTLAIGATDLTTMCVLAADRLLGHELVASSPSPSYEAAPTADKPGCQLTGSLRRARRLSDLMSLQALAERPRARIQIRGEVIGQRVYLRVALYDERLPDAELHRFFDGFQLNP